MDDRCGYCGVKIVSTGGCACRHNGYWISKVREVDGIIMIGPEMEWVPYRAWAKSLEDRQWEN